MKLMHYAGYSIYQLTNLGEQLQVTALGMLYLYKHLSFNL